VIKQRIACTFKLATLKQRKTVLRYQDRGQIVNKNSRFPVPPHSPRFRRETIQQQNRKSNQHWATAGNLHHLDWPNLRWWQWHDLRLCHSICFWRFHESSQSCNCTAAFAIWIAEYPVGIFNTGGCNERSLRLWSSFHTPPVDRMVNVLHPDCRFRVRVFWDNELRSKQARPHFRCHTRIAAWRTQEWCWRAPRRSEVHLLCSGSHDCSDAYALSKEMFLGSSNICPCPEANFCDWDWSLLTFEDGTSPSLGSLAWFVFQLQHIRTATPINRTIFWHNRNLCLKVSSKI